MAYPVYLAKNNGHFERFFFSVNNDFDNKKIAIENEVVAFNAFKNVNNVEYITFNSCYRIEESAFENCNDLTTVAFGETKENKTTNGCIYGISIPTLKNLTIQHAAFRNCSKLHTVILPNVRGKLTIEKEAFAGCNTLRTVVFPQNCTNIDISGDAFMGNSNIEFVCKEDSEVARYAREHDMKIVSF